jgi:hypothetical protein
VQQFWGVSATPIYAFFGQNQVYANFGQNLPKNSAKTPKNYPFLN